MRVFPLLRIPPARAPILRYGVAVLSTTLALIPTLLLADVAESRLALFARGGHGECMVRRLEARARCNFIRLNGQRLFLIGRTSHRGAVPHGHLSTGAICLCRASDLLVQCRTTSSARRVASV